MRELQNVLVTPLILCTDGVQKNDNHFKDLYGIDKKPIDVTGQDLADAVIQMARNQRKHLEVSYLKVWKNCIRIYFKVK